MVLKFRPLLHRFLKTSQTLIGRLPKKFLKMWFGLIKIPTLNTYNDFLTAKDSPSVNVKMPAEAQNLQTLNEHIQAQMMNLQPSKENIQTCTFKASFPMLTSTLTTALIQTHPRLLSSECQAKSPSCLSHPKITKSKMKSTPPPLCLCSLVAWSAGLGADDLTWPGLVLGAWIQVGDDHVHSLDLLVFGGDGAHLVRDLVPFHRHVLSLDAVREAQNQKVLVGIVFSVGSLNWNE